MIDSRALSVIEWVDVWVGTRCCGFTAQQHMHFQIFCLLFCAAGGSGDEVAIFNVNGCAQHLGEPRFASEWRCGGHFD